MRRRASATTPGIFADRVYDACHGKAVEWWVAAVCEADAYQALIFKDGSCMLLRGRTGRHASLAEALRAVSCFRREMLGSLLRSTWPRGAVAAMGAVAELED